jgi:hypothetical protein
MAPRSISEAEENARQKAIEDFQILLAGKLAMSTSLELFGGGEYIWLQTRPAVRFQIDAHSFTLARGEQECDLVEECGGELVPLARLALSDPGSKTASWRPSAPHWNRCRNRPTCPSGAGITRVVQG